MFVCVGVRSSSSTPASPTPSRARCEDVAWSTAKIATLFRATSKSRGRPGWRAVSLARRASFRTNPRAVRALRRRSIERLTHEARNTPVYFSPALHARAQQAEGLFCAGSRGAFRTHTAAAACLLVRSRCGAAKWMRTNAIESLKCLPASSSRRWREQSAAHSCTRSLKRKPLQKRGAHRIDQHTSAIFII